MLNTLKECLNEIECLPIVPGWKWGFATWKRFSDILNKYSISCCRDEYGNVLIGADTVETWMNRLRESRLVLQAHLDHPGAVVTRQLGGHGGMNRYLAVVRGGLQGNLVGNVFRAFDHFGNDVGDTVVDDNFNGYGEKFISFKMPDSGRLAHYLCGPVQNASHSSDDHFWEGWGLDDHVGCAVVVQALSQFTRFPVLGMLTLDEEVGGWGLLHILHAAEKHGISIQQWPLLLTFEVTQEYPDQGFICDSGMAWRKCDAVVALDPGFLEWGKKQGPQRVVSLQGGRCEAGIWTLYGGSAGCWVIPCKHYHNATADEEWRAERVARSDADSLMRAVSEIVPRYCDTTRPESVLPPIFRIQCKSPVICVNDAMSSVREAAVKSSDFVACLRDVMPHWHAVHGHFGLEYVKFAAQDWPAWRDALINSEEWKSKIDGCAGPLFKKVQKYLEIKWCHAAELPIYLFVGASFNASNLFSGVGLSVEKIVDCDIARILAHEFTHWWMKPVLDSLPARPLELTFLHEGLACLISMIVCDLTPAQAIGISNEKFDHYQNNLMLLKGYLGEWLTGDFIEVSHGRHEVVKRRHLPHPFKIGNGNEWAKYGYFLALDYMSDCLFSLPGIWTEKLVKWSSEKLCDYLTTRRSYESDQRSTM